MPFNFIQKRKKQIGRKTFGFPCTPGIKIAVLAMARRIGVPNYVLCEHLLQLAAAQISIDLEDPESERELKQHLISSHLLQPVLAENEYDEDAVERARKKRLLHQELEKVVRTLMGMVEREHIPVRLLADVTRAVIKDARYKKGGPDTNSKGGNDDNKNIP